MGVFHDPLAKIGWTLVLERAHGGDMFKHLQRSGRFGEVGARRMMSGVLAALVHIHGLDKPIIHRDVKVENIVFTVEGYAQLVDFGIACHESDAAQMSRRTGSPGYAAPELVLGENYNRKVDCFSAGVVLHYMLTGKLPFFGSNFNSILRRTVRCHLDFDKNCWNGVSNQAKAVVQHLLQKNPEDRVASDAALQSPWIDGLSEDADMKMMRHTFSHPLSKISEEHGIIDECAPEVVAPDVSPQPVSCSEFQGIA